METEKKPERNRGNRNRQTESNRVTQTETVKPGQALIESSLSLTYHSLSFRFHEKSLVKDCQEH